MKKFILLTILFLSSHAFSQEFPSLKSLLGHEIGLEFTWHHEVISFYENLHNTFENESKILEYGETNEGRKLILFFMSSEENVKSLDELRNIHSLRDSSSKLPIIWLSYNVHGNESSATESAILTAYKLLTEHKDWLKETIVIIDPCLNPDGRDRYVNFFKQYGSITENIDPSSIEHKEPWPGGRFNHYLFDLNRDWAWLTQVESQQSG